MVWAKLGNLKSLYRGTATPFGHDFYRNFSRMVEIHFREKHSVADYADLLNLAPKTLSTKFKKLNLENPNEIIKNRILLEAMRLLMYSGKSIKESLMIRVLGIPGWV